MPPQPYDRLRVFGGLGLVMLACVPVLFVALGRGDVTQSREASALLAARETWRRHHEDASDRAWLIPTANGKPQYDPPPMTVWLHMLAWTGLDPSATGPEPLIFRARLLAVAMGVLALLATYWAGMSIGDVPVARLATLALGTTLLFVHQVRIASTDTHMLAWTTLAVAAGLWAMRPLKEINWVGRRVIGWLIAGLALGAAILTQGIQPAGLFVLPPLIAAIVLTPRRRLDNLLGLSFALILGVIVAAPWYLYVLTRTPEADTALFGRALPPRELFLITWSHWRVPVVLSPWVVWLVGALCQPFIRADQERRRQLLIAWFWFLLLFVILSIPAAKSPRYLSPLLPAAALLVGQLWAFHAQLASERQMDPGVDLLRVPHWLSLAAASAVGSLLLAYQPQLVARGQLDEPLLPGLGLPEAAGLGAGLLLIVLLGVRWHYRWKPRLAAYATVAWMLAALAVCLPAYERSAEASYPHRLEAQRLATTAADRPLYFLRSSDRDPGPDAAFLFYAGRTVPPLTLAELEDAVRDHPRLGMVARAVPAEDERLRALGFEPVLEFEDDHHRRKLYILAVD